MTSLAQTFLAKRSPGLPLEMRLDRSRLPRCRRLPHNVSQRPSKVELQNMGTRTKRVIPNHVVTAHAPTTIAKIRRVAVGGKLSQQAKSFGSTYRRLDPSQPSPTVTRSGYRDFIHPTEDRMLTVRELACLQSFPETWEFKGVRLDSYSSKRKTTMTQFGQVGNAVPPLLAKAVATAVKQQIFEEPDNG